MSASGLYGPFRACDGIVGHADLLLGDGVVAVLEAELAAGGGRFKGIRHITAQDADPAVLGPMAHTPAGLMADSAFRTGFGRLTGMGLTYDAGARAAIAGSRRSGPRLPGCGNRPGPRRHAARHRRLRRQAG